MMRYITAGESHGPEIDRKLKVYQRDYLIKQQQISITN